MGPPPPPQLQPFLPTPCKDGQLQVPSLCPTVLPPLTPSIVCSQTNSLGLVFKQRTVSRFALSVCTSQEDLALRRDSSSALFSHPRSYKGVFEVTAEQVSVHHVHRHVLASLEFRMTSLAGTPVCFPPLPHFAASLAHL